MEKCTFCEREKNKVGGLMKSKCDNIYICDVCASEFQGVFSLSGVVLNAFEPDGELKGRMRGRIFFRDEEFGAWKKKRTDFRYKIKNNWYFKDPWDLVQENCSFCREIGNNIAGLMQSSVKDNVYICKTCVNVAYAIFDHNGIYDKCAVPPDEQGSPANNNKCQSKIKNIRDFFRCNIIQT